MKKFSRKFKILILFIIFVTIWIILAPVLANFLIVEKEIENADVIWILAGSATYIERNQTAALVYKKGNTSKVILTNDGGYGGWSKTEQRNPPFVELAKNQLVSQGVPAEAIEILPGTVEGTDEEADLFAKTVREQNLKSVLLVTSAYHSRRTLWTFEQSVIKNGLIIKIGLQTSPTGQQTPPPANWWLSRKGWKMVGGEYVKIIYYWLFY